MPATERDMAKLRNALTDVQVSAAELSRKKIIRPIADIIFDWFVIFAVIAVALRIHNALIWSLAIFVVGNRQRALANLLHDAAHSNLLPSRRWNDRIARSALAPGALTGLTAYRRSHALHHSQLGKERLDPDLIQIPSSRRRTWATAYLHVLVCAPEWWGNLLGDLRSPRKHLGTVVGIVAWWIAFYIILDHEAGPTYAIAFAMSWWLARATVYHAITSFREMCDHFGLQSGGILSFTRDVATRSWLRPFIHPHNNGYHLTHHLLPTIPYHQLPKVQGILKTLPIYMEGVCCDGYIIGRGAVVHRWTVGDNRDG